jgi:hypothetical protein
LPAYDHGAALRFWNTRDSEYDEHAKLPVPVDVVGLLADYLVARALDPDPEARGNQGAYLLRKAADVGEVVPSLQARHGEDAKQWIATNTLYDQLKRFFDECGRVLDSPGDAKGADRLARASTHPGAAHPCVACDRPRCTCCRRTK